MPQTVIGQRLHPILLLALAGYWSAFALASHWPRLDFKAEGVAVPSPFLDKAAHVVAFAGLAVLIWASGLGAVALRRFGVERPAWAAPWLGTAALAFGYAVIDEGTQQFVAGRTMSAPDLLADASGIVLGIAWAWWVWRWWRGEVQEKPETQETQEAQGKEIPPGALSTSTVDEAGDQRDRSPDHESDDGFVAHAAVVSILTLVSRVTGLVRDAVLLAIFGASQTMSAFFFGFMVPNLARRLFGEGALTAAFLPRYRRLIDDDPGLARSYAVACGVRVTLVLFGLVALGELVLLGLLFGIELSDKAALAIRLTALMLPYAPLVCGTAFLGAVLQAHGRFAAVAVAPVGLNLGMIAASAVAVWSVEGDVNRAMVVAVGVLICGAGQVAWVAWALRSKPAIGRTNTDAGRGSMRQPETTEPLSRLLRSTLVAMGPMIVGLGVFQINTLLDGLIAYGLAAPESADAASTLQLLGRSVDYPVGPGAMAQLTAAQRLYQFPLGVFGIAIATAIFPAFAAAGRDGQRQRFSAIVRRGVRLTWFIGLPATVGLLLVREPLVRVMFERGAFERADAAAVSWVLLGYGTGVWAYSLTHVLTRAFYARDDAGTPLKVAVAMVGFNLLLNLTLIWPLGAAGLAWSTAVSATMQCVVLLTLLQKHADAPVGQGVGSAMGKSFVAVGAMAAVLIALLIMIPTSTLNVPGSAALLAVLVPTGAAVFLAVAVALRCEELRWLVKR